MSDEWNGGERRKDYINLGCEINELRTAIAVVENKITNVDKRINGSIDDIKSHIAAGSKWRLAIVIALVGLLAFWTNNAIKFGVQQRESQYHNDEIRNIQQQIYLLNYERGVRDGREKELPAK